MTSRDIKRASDTFTLTLCSFCILCCDSLKVKNTRNFKLKYHQLKRRKSLTTCVYWRYANKRLCEWYLTLYNKTMKTVNLIFHELPIFQYLSISWQKEKNFLSFQFSSQINLIQRKLQQKFILSFAIKF